MNIDTFVQKLRNAGLTDAEMENVDDFCAHELMITLRRCQREITPAPRAAQRSVVAPTLKKVSQGPKKPWNLRAALGRNYVGPKEWESALGDYGMTVQFDSVPEFPWGQDVLDASDPWDPTRKISETHLAFLGPTAVNGEPLTIENWFKWFQGHFLSIKEDEAFVKVACEARWHLVRMKFVSGTRRGGMETKLQHLGEAYALPSAVTQLTMCQLARIIHRDYPGSGYVVLCSDRAANNGYAGIKNDAMNNLHTHAWPLNLINSDISSLGAERK